MLDSANQVTIRKIGAHQRGREARTGNPQRVFRAMKLFHMKLLWVTKADKCHYKCAQTHKMYSANSEPHSNLR